MPSAASRTGQQIVRGRFDQIDLAVDQRIDRRLHVRNPEPLDPVDLGDLAAGGPRRRLVPRLVPSNFVNTALLPGSHSSRANTNGPEPTYSEICSETGVSAIRLGMMKGTFELGLASDWSTRP
jgi:hypothetical protein